MKTPARFGLIDYWRMLRRRGPRLPVSYFLQAHLFDLRHGTDTHTRLQKDEYTHRPEHFEDGELYQSSWSSEVRWAYRKLRARITPANWASRAFVDVGCGKGKVVLEWELLLARDGLRQRVLGLDYHEPLLSIARTNHRKVVGGDGEFVLADAATQDFAVFGNDLILYMYNPFASDIVRRLLERLPTGDVFIVYNNPVHRGAVEAAGFMRVDAHPGFHPNCTTDIYRRVGAGAAT